MKPEISKGSFISTKLYTIVTEFDKTSLPHTSNYSPINTRNFMINDGIDPEILLYFSISFSVYLWIVIYKCNPCVTLVCECGDQLWDMITIQ